MTKNFYANPFSLREALRHYNRNVRREAKAYRAFKLGYEYFLRSKHTRGKNQRRNSRLSAKWFKQWERLTLKPKRSRV